METEICDNTQNLEDEFLILQDLYIKGDDIQKLSVIQSLPQLLQTDSNATISRIIPKIQQELPNSSCEFHIATSKTFRLLIERQIPINLLTQVLQGIESRDPIISSTWMETLLTVIPNLTADKIKSDVLPLAVNKSQLSRPVYYRISSCKMLGLVSVHPGMEAFDIKKDVVPLAQSLCQDCYYEVRAAMCAQLPLIAQGLANEIMVKTSLLPGLVELASDENMSVRSVAIDAAVGIIPQLKKDNIQTTIVPLIKQLCMKSVEDGDTTFKTLAKNYGKLLDSLQAHLTPSDCGWFLDFFKGLARKGYVTVKQVDAMDPNLGVTCREYCALNLPTVTFFTISQVSAQIDTWYLIFKDLASDPCYIVRKAIAGCIREIARILGPQNRMIKLDMVKLLRDEAEEVLEVLVPNIGPTLELFCMYGVLSRETVLQSTLELGRALIKCHMEVSKGHNWRMQMLFLVQLEHLPNCMPSDFIHQHFTPVVFNATLEARARPVRSQATRTLLIFLRYNLKEVQRKWIRENLVSRLCYANSCYTRHIFIRLCVHAIDIFSNKYFKEFFFTPLLTLADDPVSNIRLCTLNLFPKLKQMIVLPVEKTLQFSMDSIVAKMEVIEKDKDVLATLKCKLKEMRTPQVAKAEAMVEEKRRIEEEEKISQGRYLEVGKPGTQASRQTPVHISRQNVMKAIASARSVSAPNRPAPYIPPASDMSFLVQHFYTDAGISFPDRIDDEIGEKQQDILNEDDEKSRGTGDKKDFDSIDYERYVGDELNGLTLSSNITDDAKADLQKIRPRRLKVTEQSVKNTASVDNIKIRPKRHSSIYSISCLDSGVRSDTSLKRRSLNITPTESSRIPVPFRATKNLTQNRTSEILYDDSFSFRRSKSDCGKLRVSDTSREFLTSDIKMNFVKSRQIMRRDLGPQAYSMRQNQSLKNVEIKKVPKKNNLNNNKKQNERCGDENFSMGTTEVTVSKNEVKENVPISQCITENLPKSITSVIVKDNATKASGLPVLKRRAQSEVRK